MGFNSPRKIDPYNDPYFKGKANEQSRRTLSGNYQSFNYH